MPSSNSIELFLNNPKAHRLVGRRSRMRRQSLLIPITTVAKSLGITAENMQAFEQGEGVLTADQFKKLQTTLRLSRNELCQGLAVA